MKAVFADSFYFLAIMNPRDHAHHKALAFSERTDVNIVTTAWVLTELGDGLSRTATRSAFSQILYSFDAEDIVVSPSQSLFERGIEMYRSRIDKDWSLTDCISFVVMNDYGLTDVLTGDHHFEQAGFRALLSS